MLFRRFKSLFSDGSTRYKGWIIQPYLEGVEGSGWASVTFVEDMKDKDEYFVPSSILVEMKWSVGKKPDAWLETLVKTGKDYIDAGLVDKGYVHTIKIDVEQGIFGIDLKIDGVFIQIEIDETLQDCLRSEVFDRCASPQL